jgi:hypothetical protein
MDDISASYSGQTRTEAFTAYERDKAEMPPGWTAVYQQWHDEASQSTLHVTWRYLGTPAAPVPEQPPDKRKSTVRDYLIGFALLAIVGVVISVFNQGKDTDTRPARSRQELSVAACQDLKFEHDSAVYTAALYQTQIEERQARGDPAGEDVDAQSNAADRVLEATRRMEEGGCFD